jgi:c-di-GMP-binding flagellar brake protein YcgR
MTAHPGKALKSSSERRQRRFPRYRTEFPVSLHLLSTEGSRRSLTGQCKDLSEAGIGILIAAELALSEVMALSFALPGSTHPWNVRAVLRHRRGYHYGFEFLSLADTQTKALREYLSTLSRADADIEPQAQKPATSESPRRNKTK